MFLTCLAAALGLATSAQAAPVAKPAWRLSSMAAPTAFEPGGSIAYYQVEATNAGGAPTDGTPITLVDKLPPGLILTSLELKVRPSAAIGVVDVSPAACQTSEASGAMVVTCRVDESLPSAPAAATVRPSRRLVMVLKVSTPETTSGPLVNLVEVEGGGAAAVAIESPNLASSTSASSGVAEFSAGLSGADGAPESQAASHPFAYTTSFTVNTERAPEFSSAPLLGAGGDVKDLEFELPPGLVGNPLAADRCTSQQFTVTGFTTVEGTQFFPSECPDGSAVGVLALRQLEGHSMPPAVGPVYNLVPPSGMPAELGFTIAGLPFYIETEVRSGSDYGITARLRNVSQTKRITGSSLTLWGVPGSAAHDSLRGLCAEVGGSDSCPLGGGTPAPFLRLPTSCQLPLVDRMTADSWTHPGAYFEKLFAEPAPSGCGSVPFGPTVEARPTTNVADAPSGLHVDVHLPQRENEAPEGLGEADLKDATVTLPPGLAVNPSSADGLGACSEAQIGYLGEVEGQQRFSPAAANCPDASKLGTVEIDTPLLDHPLPGAVYLARQGENPFGSLIAIYITAFDPATGVVVKLPGKVSPDPVTGQLTTTVKQSPQLPFEDFKLDFFEGARGPLRTPAVCTTYTTATSLVPWSAPQGAVANPADSFAISASPNGGACPGSPAQRPAALRFEAGAAAPLAGAYSPFIVHLARDDDSQEISGLNVALPPGVLGRLAGIPYCPDAALAAAAAKSGRAEQAAPSCPAASRVGGVTVGAGAGPDPFYVGGSAYLAGPYKGAPLSLAIVTPAVAGPFDLGTVVVRAALHVNPETAQVSVDSDPIPTILRGIPLDVRSIAVRMDRAGFTLNPTSCTEKTVSGTATSVQGQVIPLSNRFQVGGCASLPFKPRLKLAVLGKTNRNGKPRLRAVLTTKPGEANIARAQVNLPHSEFLESNHIKTVCTRVQFAAGNGNGSACPKGSVYGHATAWTPLLDRPLEGPVYLRSSSHNLPDLVAALDGQIDVALDGKVDSGPNEGIRNTFEVVPDAPVSRFVLTMRGGKKGLLVNSENLCAKHTKTRAIVRLAGQNGKVRHWKPKVANSCKKARKHVKRSKHHRRRH